GSHPNADYRGHAYTYGGTYANTYADANPYANAAGDGPYDYRLWRGLPCVPRARCCRGTADTVRPRRTY
ncbi:MAG: hypothetical protein ACE5H6_02150, partial [Dehalococcoidia bacterium]